MFKTASIAVSTIATVQASYPAQSSSYATSDAHAAHDSNSASQAHSAAVGGYDNDQYAQQAYGSDQDDRWGRSYDSVKAQSFTDEQYARGVKADDDQWAVDYDEYTTGDAASSSAAASAESAEAKVVSVYVAPTKKDDGFKAVKGTSDLNNYESVDASGHYLDAFPALPTIPQNQQYGNYGQQAQ